MIMNVKDSLGIYFLKKSETTINKERILQGNFKRPENYKEIENDKSCVFIWGDESSNELIEKVMSQELNHRIGLGILIFSVLNTFHPEKVLEFFKLLRNKDIITYDTFKSKTELLQLIGLESKKWYEFWK